MHYSLSLSLSLSFFLGGDKIGFFFQGERFTMFASVIESRPLEKSGVSLSVKLEYKASGVREEG